MRYGLMGVIVVICHWLMACASKPLFATEQFCRPAAATTARLKVELDGRSQYLLLRSEPGLKKTVFVALDNIGSPQFSATLISGQLALERSPLYRGPDPKMLLWGYNWWSLPTKTLAACAESAGLQLDQAQTSINLLDNGRRYWHWSSARPLQYDLPQHGLSISVTPLEK